MLTEIVNYVCWIGSKFMNSTDRRTLYVVGMTRIALHKQALMHLMFNGKDGLPGLREMENVEVFLDYKDLEKRDIIIAIGFKNIGYVSAVQEYEKRGVIVYERVVTSLYSSRMLKSFNMNGAVRVSPLHCNSPEDIVKFLEISAEIAKL